MKIFGENVKIMHFETVFHLIPHLFTLSLLHTLRTIGFFNFRTITYLSNLDGFGSFYAKLW